MADTALEEIRLGDPEEAAAVHRAAGLVDVAAVRVLGSRTAPDGTAYWKELSAENGHFRRIAGAVSESETEALVTEIDARFAPYREGDHLCLPRTLVLVTAHH
jgi:hypothetical protein